MSYSLINHLHIVTGTISFLIGPLQFLAVIRSRYTKLHRLLGKTFILCVFLSAPTGLFLSFKTTSTPAGVGTALQSILWFTFTWLAYASIKKQRVSSHQRWMIRSYALVLCAPFLRLTIMLGDQFFNMHFIENFSFYYPLMVWLSFIPLIIAELYIRFHQSPTDSLY